MKVFDKILHAFVEVKQKVNKDGTAPEINEKKDMPNAERAIKSRPSRKVDDGDKERASEND